MKMNEEQLRKILNDNKQLKELVIDLQVRCSKLLDRARKAEYKLKEIDGNNN